LFGDFEAEAGAFIVKIEDGFEVVEGTVVHIGAGLGGVAYGRARGVRDWVGKGITL
jgi:hypothetical protein